MGDEMSKIHYNSIYQIIEYCLKQGHEGDYWDFKQEWHTEMDNLIKDIICFANTAHDEDCYIIFGVTDELQIVGMKNSRIMLANIIDVLSNIQFAGDVCPAVDIKTLTMQGYELDVLIIKNTDRTPIYLKRNYGAMHGGNIYLRIGDRNTPDKGNADIHNIEMLWKKRLGLTKPPLEYIFDRLHNPLEWAREGDGFYNIYRPEYALLYKEEEEEYSDKNEFYSYAMCNEKTMFRILQIKYHGTVLEEYQIAILDSGRYITPVPEWGFVCRSKNNNQAQYGYKYYIEGSALLSLHLFFYDPKDGEERYARDRFLDVVLIYRSEEEKEEFEEYVDLNQNRLEELISNGNRYSHIQSASSEKIQHYIKMLNTGLAMNKMLEFYREQI